MSWARSKKRSGDSRLNLGNAARAYALKAEKGLEVGMVTRSVELFALDAGLTAGVAAELVEDQPA